MNTNDAIRRAVRVFAAHRDRDLPGLIAALERDGLPHELAVSVVEFLPMAFGRAFTEGMGVRYPDYYIRVDAQGRERARRKVLDEPVYRAARALMPEVAAESRE